MDLVSQESLQQILDDAVSRHGVPGAQLVVQNGDTCAAAVAGQLNTETGEAVREQSLFQIGSITKVVTATAIMILRDQGKLELDDPVRKHLPEFRTADLDACKTVTLRHLLSHTSGLDGDMHSDTGCGDDMIERLVERYALLPQLYPVGDRFSYSNAGFNILGRIIEVLTGKSYDKAIREMVFEPLGLKDAFCSPLDIVGKSTASGHTPSPDGNGLSPVSSLYIIPISSAPAGIVMMSASDLMTFARMHMKGGMTEAGERILSEQSVGEMQETSVNVQVVMRDIDRWGLGWFKCTVNGGEFFGHDGGTIGQSAYLRIHAASGTALVLLTNGGAANDCSAEIFGKLLDPLTDTSAGAVPVPTGERPDDLQPFTGLFRNVGGDTEVVLSDGKLVRRAFNRIDDWKIEYPELELQYAGDNNFVFYQPPAKTPSTLTYFDFDDNGIPQTIFAGMRVFNRVR